MAITMNDATIEDSQRQALNSFSFDDSGLGGDAFGGEKLVGITAEFVSQFRQVIGDYKQGIWNVLSKLDSQNETSAFQGEAIISALKKFVSEVKYTSNLYASMLSAAETQIVQSVEQVYAKQDTSLKDNLTEDTKIVNDARTNLYSNVTKG